MGARCQCVDPPAALCCEHQCFCKQAFGRVILDSLAFSSSTLWQRTLSCSHSLTTRMLHLLAGLLLSPFPAAPLPPLQVAQVAQQSGWHFQAAPLPPMAGGTAGTAVGVAFSSSTSPSPGRWHSLHHAPEMPVSLVA